MMMVTQHDVCAAGVGAPALSNTQTTTTTHTHMLGMAVIAAVVAHYLS